jgi:pimeloyl-ACP methyl ester carboxylesterase
MRWFRITWMRGVVVLGGVAVATVVGVSGVGWYYSSEIEDGAFVIEREPEEYDVRVVALDGDLVTLEGPEGSDPRKEPRITGLEWPGGYATVGGILAVDGPAAERPHVLLEGALAVGDRVRYDNSAYPDDPARAHGIPFTEVRFAAPLGELAAWRVEGPGDSWAIFVHGKGSNWGEALRMLPTMHRAGMPALVITYRNDEGAPEDPSAYYQFGATEWADLDAAARYAFDQGAERLVLVGYSMGGGIVASFLYRSSLADRVAGVILDSPMLDLGATVDLAGRQRGLPSFLTGVAKVLTSARFGVDWGEMDHLARADEIEAPLLLFHGDADEKVPMETSARLARLRPDIVTHVAVEGASHVAAWNVDPEAYEAAVREFLDRVAR